MRLFCIIRIAEAPKKRYTIFSVFLVKSSELETAHVKETTNCTIKNPKAFRLSSLDGAYYFHRKPHFEPRYECYGFTQIFLVIRGKGRYTTESGSYRFGPGMMLYRHAGRRTIYEWESEEAELAIVNFVCRSKAAAAFLEAPLLLFGEERATLLDLIKTTVRITENYTTVDGQYAHRPRPDVPDAVFSYLYSSLERFLSMVYCRLSGFALVVSEAQKVGRHLEEGRLAAEVRAYLEENAHKPLTLSDVCRRFHIGQTTLSSIFRKETGESIMGYHAACRITLAKDRIAEGATSFTAIAEELGFSSVNYFSKVFLTHVGMSPTAYSRAVSKRRAEAE